MLTLDVRASAGDDIDRTAVEMQALSNRLGLCVQVKFNEVTCWAFPGGSAGLLAAEYRRASAEKIGPQFKFASSTFRRPRAQPEGEADHG